MPRLTVLMPARNAERYIGRAIRSTLAALPRDAELLVWDDASTDSTAEVVATFDDERVKLTSSSYSAGSGVARDRLLASSDSEFVAAMDADDICFRWRFSAQLRRLSLGRAAVTFGSVVRFGGRRVPIPTIPRRVFPDEAPWVLAVSNPFFHSTMMGRRDVITDAGGYGRARVAQDYALWLRLAASGAAIEVVPIALSGYRLSSTQVSSSADYFDRIRREPEVIAAYNALWSRLIGGEPVGALDPEAVNRAILGHLETLPTSMRRSLQRQIRSTGSFTAPVPSPSDAERGAEGG